MKYFITGGAGFVGSNLVDKLIKNNEVVIYDNLTSGRKEFFAHHEGKKNFKFILGDVLDRELLIKSMKGSDFVVHLASNPDISRSFKEPDLDLKQGIITTFNVLDAMRLNGIKKIAYNSGSGVYGDQGATYTPEDFGPLLPNSMYGASKLGSEGIISAFCQLYDMQSWIFRPANLIGRRQTHGVGFDFIRKLKKNPKELEILGNGKQSKSYLYIDDYLEAILLAIKKSKNQINLFNVASDTFIDVTTIGKITCQVMGLENVKFNYTGGRGGWKGDVPVVRMGTKKLKALGWKAKLNSAKAFEQSIKDILKEI